MDRQLAAVALGASGAWLSACGESPRADDAGIGSAAGESAVQQSGGSGAGGSENGPGVMHPAANGLCYEVLDEIHACFGEALGRQENIARLQKVADDCAQASSFTEDQKACVDCLMDVFETCDARRFQIRAGVRACATCGDYGRDIANNIPLNTEVIGCDRPEAEVCDGLDNDCDGVVDDHFVCPDPDVENPQPFTDRVYVAGGQPGSCSGLDVYPAWPEAGESLDRLSCPTGIHFGGDGQLYYSNRGFFWNDREARTYVNVSVPPCTTSVFDLFSVDAKGAPYYSCSSNTPLYRDGVEIGPPGMKHFVGALADGRFITVSESDALLDWGSPPKHALDYVLYDADGNELSRASPHTEFDSVDLVPDPRVGHVFGSAASVVFVHDRDVDPEMLIYAVGSEDEFVLVRRRPTPVINFNQSHFAAPDGSFYYPEKDTLFREAADGTRESVWTYTPVASESFEIKYVLPGP